MSDTPLTPQSEMQCPQCFRRSWHDTAIATPHVCPVCLLPLKLTGRHTNPAYRETFSPRAAKYAKRSSIETYTITLDPTLRAGILNSGTCLDTPE